MEIQDVQKICNEIADTINQFIIGKSDVVEKLLIGLLANGHILFEDFPGLGKTQLVKLISQIVGLNFKRIQFTPDLLPADITGSYIFDLKNQEFILREGPVFSQLVLADEINRAPPKTQAALLEAMGESQVSIEGNAFFLNPPFWVIATQNPIELEGTFGLPEAQLDRFMMRLRLGYPTSDQEQVIIENRMKRREDKMTLTKQIDSSDFIHFQKLVETVTVVPDILGYIVNIVQATREHEKLEVGSSPRGSLALLALSRASAVYHGRSYVIPEDVKTFAVPALGHRVILKSSEWLGGSHADQIIQEILNKTVAPRKDISFVK